MKLWLAFKLFGNGWGLAAPGHDETFYWLSGEFYRFLYGFGAQLKSFEWFMPKPGTRRTIAGRDFVVFLASRRWLLVDVSWAMPSVPAHDLDGAHTIIRALKHDLDTGNRP